MQCLLRSQKIQMELYLKQMSKESFNELFIVVESNNKK